MKKFPVRRREGRSVSADRMKILTHLDEKGRARMVDVTEKAPSEREAVARGSVTMNNETFLLVKKSQMAKGDVLGVARVAGIIAAKKTAELIPLCHPLPVSSVSLDFDLDRKRGSIDIEARVKTTAQTGVEMEALTAVSVAALTIYDMCKAADKEMIISDILLVEKRGGKSGLFKRQGMRQ